jgi:4-hydroxybenzoate polyprenyltransferase
MGESMSSGMNNFIVFTKNGVFQDIFVLGKDSMVDKGIYTVDKQKGIIKASMRRGKETIKKGDMYFMIEGKELHIRLLSPGKSLFDFFLFSSLYIALCAVLMVHQTNHLMNLHYNTSPLFYFVFSSTICSYNFHWYLTPATATEKLRTAWTLHHKSLHLLLYIVGLAGSAWFAFRLIDHWFWLGGAVVLTFLYSAPKVPLKPFTQLRKIAIGKTIFLAFVWMYVTTFLPIIFSEGVLRTPHLLFCLSRLFLIYSICIIFDYRDRENDKKEGIRSVITYLNERGIDRLFSICIFLFFLATALLYWYNIRLTDVLLLLLPGAIVIGIYQYSKKHFSDYLYYFVLDGLMMLSALFTSLFSI